MATPLLTVTALREHLNTDMPDSALQRILDSETAEIAQRYGDVATQTEMLHGLQRSIVLTRPSQSIVSVVEQIDTELYDDLWEWVIQVIPVTWTLDSSDYRIWENGRYLERVPIGTHPRILWGNRVTVTYVPVDKTSQRVLVLIQLCKLAVAYSGVNQMSVARGDYSEVSKDYVTERERLLRTLRPRGIIFA